GIEAVFGPTGAIPAATGDLEFEFDEGAARFEAQVSHLPEGVYDLLVGGVVMGQITVNAQGSGELEFDTEVGTNDLFLNFDPRGQLVQVTQGGTVILEILFPTVDPEDDQGEDEF